MEAHDEDNDVIKIIVVHGKEHGSNHLGSATDMSWSLTLREKVGS